MKIAIEVNKRDIFSKINMDDYKVLVDLPGVSRDLYWERMLIIDGVKYTANFYSHDHDMLVVHEVTDAPDDLYITTDYKDRPQTFQESDPTCPICGCTISDAFELSDETEMDCPECHALLSIERIVDVSYDTTVLEVREPIVVREEVSKDEK